jgi:hypothetical protein
MATSFKGWGTSWGNSWGTVAVDPNEMAGGTGFSLTASAQATALLFAQGTSSIAIAATGTLTAATTSLLGGTLLLALHGTGGAGFTLVLLERRPKATSIRLKRFQESRAWALHARATSRVRTVTAVGQEYVVFVAEAIPGRTTLLGAKAVSRTHAAQPTATGRVQAEAAVATTHSRDIPVHAGASATVGAGKADTVGRMSKSSGDACGVSTPTTGYSTCNFVRSRGVRRLSDSEIVAIVRVTIDNRR